MAYVIHLFSMFNLNGLSFLKHLFTKLFKTINFAEINEYSKLINEGYVGFASVYLKRSNEEFKADDEIDKSLYKQLFDLDEKLGTTQTKQLKNILQYSLNVELLKV